MKMNKFNAVDVAIRDPRTTIKMTAAPIQSRRSSLAESLLNVAIGYSVAVASQILIFPLFGIQVPISTNIEIGLYFTAISIVRSYLVRRWFNGRLVK